LGLGLGLGWGLVLGLEVLARTVDRLGHRRGEPACHEHERAARR